MNIIEVGLSFAEGLALIASPCILPVLPLMLSASIDGGRKRPFGIIVGFVLAFTLFALFARKAVMLLGIDLDYIKYASLVLLTGFAVILFSEKLSQKFSNLTGRFAGVGGSLASNNKEGFV
ncbi:MAG: cytochrome c biogenesis protein DipZ, partial [Pseudomonadota bacterium]